MNDSKTTRDVVGWTKISKVVLKFTTRFCGVGLMEVNSIHLTFPYI